MRVKLDSMVSISEKGTKEMFYLTTDSTHFIYGYMASDISIPEKNKKMSCTYRPYTYVTGLRVCAVKV